MLFFSKFKLETRSMIKSSAIKELDLSTTGDYGEVLSSLEQIIDTHDTANRAFSELGHAGSRDIVRTQAPGMFTKVTALKSELDGAGAVILHETRIDRLDDEVAQMASIAIASLFDSPTRTDQRNE